jgi:hypothetical protein
LCVSLHRHVPAAEGEVLSRAPFASSGRQRRSSIGTPRAVMASGSALGRDSFCRRQESSLARPRRSAETADEVTDKGIDGRLVQRTDFPRRAFVVFRGRPPSRPFARDARALTVLRRAPMSAATPTMSTLFFWRAETRATRTCAPDRVPGWASRYSVNTARRARSALCLAVCRGIDG